MFGVLIPAATYYVDPGGSDSNNGTSSTTPFATIAKVMTQTITSTTSIAIGSRIPNTTVAFREEINSTQAGLTVIGYGTTQPLLDSSTVIAAGAWSKTAGATNVYQATLPMDNVLGWIRAWESGVSFPRVASIAAVDAAAGSYFPSADPNNMGVVSMTLYIHTTAGGNPGTNGLVYEYNQRAYGVSLGTNGTIINVATQRNLANDGSIVCQAFCRLTDTLSSDGTKHNVFVSTGSYVFRSVAHNAYYAGQAAVLFIYYADTPNFEGVTFDHTNAYADAIQPFLVGYDGHTEVLGVGSFGAVLFKTVTASGLFTGIVGTMATSLTILNATVTNSTFDVGIYNLPGVTISGSSLTGCVQQCVGGTGGIVPVTITGTTLAAASAACCADIIIGVSSLSIHTSTIGQGWEAYYLLVGGALSSDFNTFTASNFFHIPPAADYANLAAYKAGTGQDAHSTP